jgi:hypothetical protein
MLTNILKEIGIELQKDSNKQHLKDIAEPYLNEINDVVEFKISQFKNLVYFILLLLLLILIGTYYNVWINYKL